MSKAFLEWWQAYPHKVGKAAAVKSYDRARGRGVPAEVLLAGVRRYVAEQPVDRPWCNPATWLNQGRWEDEGAAPAPAKVNGHGPTRYAPLRDPTEIMAELRSKS